MFCIRVPCNDLALSLLVCGLSSHANWLASCWCVRWANAGQWDVIYVQIVRGSRHAHQEAQRWRGNQEGGEKMVIEPSPSRDGSWRQHTQTAQICDRIPLRNSGSSQGTSMSCGGGGGGQAGANKLIWTGSTLDIHKRWDRSIGISGAGASSQQPGPFHMPPRANSTSLV